MGAKTITSSHAPPTRVTRAASCAYDRGMYRDNASPSPTEARLFDADGIAIATFLGSPVAGSIAWALNLRKLGETGSAWLTLVGGLAVTAVWMLIAQHLPNGAAMGGNVGLTLGVRELARRRFAAASVAERLPVVAWHSRGRAAAVGVLGMVIVLGGLAVAFAFGPDSIQSRVQYRPNVYVYYETGATEEEARKVAAELDRMGFFAGGQAIDLRIERTPRGHALSFVVTRAKLDADPTLEGGFRAIGRDLQPHTDPTGQLEVRLCDEEWNAHTRLTAP